MASAVVGFACTGFAPDEPCSNAGCDAGVGDALPEVTPPAQPSTSSPDGGTEASATSAPDAATPNITLALGTGFSCALFSSGTVRCWGSNEHGQQLRTAAITTDVAHVVLDHVRTLAVGADSDHACAGLDDGRIVCWGVNDNLQLGSSPAVDSFLAKLVVGVASPARLASGMTATCATDDNDVLTCWGNWNGAGDLAPGRGPDVGHALASLSLGSQFGCAVSGAGELTCFGLPQRSELGGSGSRVAPLPGTAVARVSTSYFHACAALRDGHVACWGLDEGNGLGPLPDGGLDMRPVGTTPEVVIEAPRLVPGVDDAIDVATGRAHTCVLRRGGTVACWGTAMGGINGDPNGETTMLAKDVPGLHGVTGLAVGFQHTCVVVEDRDVYCWGMDDTGQLGDGMTRTSSATPQLVRM